ncbi:50S ribosomal protein L19 [Candidatus Legionella polyplacis]|uniref:50S ribosomal protein L19 n=1 Tax=Candidatus Legionella polyplacis TaxID=2005262 RepID=UPI000C1F1965|nr:50S ribosomal protein L19 [Candidatus Legionella polyplacis]ATW01886.1 50S ribosomal protein L19 [Candidatus Legionella polyplacis]
MNDILNQINYNSIKNKKIPKFNPGDTIIVQIVINENDNRKRLQNFEGVVIAKKNRGLNSSFTIRKISHNIGVEKVLLTYSPIIKNISIKKQGLVKRAKLYYLRSLKGKLAKIREKLPKIHKKL